MSLTILEAGMQASLQASPRIGFRHQGVPHAGAADQHSYLLGNIALGNRDCASIEITGGGFKAKFNKPTTFCITGAPTVTLLNDLEIPLHKPVTAKAGDTIFIPPPHLGLRYYLSIAGGFSADVFLGNSSTYMPARFGGYKGRALRSGDQIEFAKQPLSNSPRPIPDELIPFFSSNWAIRFCQGPEYDLLTNPTKLKLKDTAFSVSSRISRMGAQLEGQTLDVKSDGQMQSEPVFPGTIQCPENGRPFILLCDAQTTGGYPRIGQVISSDIHRLGQIKPKDTISLIQVTNEEAQELAQSKKNTVSDWLNS